MTKHTGYETTDDLMRESARAVLAVLIDRAGDAQRDITHTDVDEHLAFCQHYDGHNADLTAVCRAFDARVRAEEAEDLGELEAAVSMARAAVARFGWEVDETSGEPVIIEPVTVEVLTGTRYRVTVRGAKTTDEALEAARSVVLENIGGEGEAIPAHVRAELEDAEGEADTIAEELTHEG